MDYPRQFGWQETIKQKGNMKIRKKTLWILAVPIYSVEEKETIEER